MIVLAIGWLKPNRHVKQTHRLTYSLLTYVLWMFLFLVLCEYDHWVLFYVSIIIGSCFMWVWSLGLVLCEYDHWVLFYVSIINESCFVLCMIIGSCFVLCEYNHWVLFYVWSFIHSLGLVLFYVSIIIQSCFISCLWQEFNEINFVCVFI